MSRHHHHHIEQEHNIRGVDHVLFFIHPKVSVSDVVRQVSHTHISLNLFDEAFLVQWQSTVISQSLIAVMVWAFPRALHIACGIHSKSGFVFAASCFICCIALVTRFVGCSAAQRSTVSTHKEVVVGSRAGSDLLIMCFCHWQRRGSWGHVLTPAAAGPLT